MLKKQKTVVSLILALVMALTLPSGSFRADDSVGIPPPSIVEEDEVQTDELSSDETQEDETVADETEEDETVTDETQEDELVTDENQEDETVTDETQEDETVTDETQEDELVTDETQEDETVTDETQEDETVTDETQEDETVADETQEDESIEDETQEDESVTDETEEDESVADETQKDETVTDETQEDKTVVKEAQEDELVAKKGVVALAEEIVALADPLQGEAKKGTPQLGNNDTLWAGANVFYIGKSTIPDSTEPHATGVAKVLWDDNYIYVRVEVTDPNLFTGTGGAHMDDSLEFYLGAGTSGANQYRVSPTGVLSGKSISAAWTEITSTGYIAEVQIPKLVGDWTEDAVITFDIYINNSTAAGGDRYEVVSWYGTPDSAYTSDASYRDSLKFVAGETDDRYSITATAGAGGTISPSAVGDVVRVAANEDAAFTITPDRGKVVDTLTVDGVVTSLSGGAYTFPFVSANHTINVTFKDNENARVLPFIVYNDNFARGEYTTAVIIDLGEGNAADGSKLTIDMFKVTARNTTRDGSAVTFAGERTIRRVYANDKPEPLGYLGYNENSPDYQEGLASGRYIVVEFDFYNAGGGAITLDGQSNSTLQVYNIVQNANIPLAGTAFTLDLAVFNQTGVVNPIFDKFDTSSESFLSEMYISNYGVISIPGSYGRALYSHKDASGNVIKGLPLYVYIHGNTRGGQDAANDPFAAMKSANGAVAMMQHMKQDPVKYAAHVLNISCSTGFTGMTSQPPTELVKAYIDSLVDSGQVDPNRIYVAGFSLGGMYTNRLVNDFPGLFAAAAPMSGVSGYPGSNNDPVDPGENAGLAYWPFINYYNTASNNTPPGEGSYIAGYNAFVENSLPLMSNARATLFYSNEAFSWPYSQFDQPNQRPDMSKTRPLDDQTAHEVEAAVLYNKINDTAHNWNIVPTAGTLDTKFVDVFDWMFTQSKTLELGVPASFTAKAGTGQVTLTWTAPVDNGAPLTGYKVWYEDRTPVTVAASATSYTFTGLSAKTYTFSIVALKADGEGSELTATATPTAAVPAPAPTSAPTATPTQEPSYSSPGGSSPSSTSAPASATSAPPTTPAPTVAPISVIPSDEGKVSVEIAKKGVIVELVLSDVKIEEIISKAANNTAGFDLTKTTGITSASSPVKALAALSKSGLNVEFALPQATITFGRIVLNSMTLQAKSSNITVSAKEADATVLNESQKTAAGSRPVIELQVFNGTTLITSFGGAVEVRVPYILKPGERANGLTIYRLDASGNKQVVKESRYENGYVVFMTPKFSLYMIGYNGKAFPDVSASHPAYDAIAQAAAKGLVAGDEKGNFNPEQKLTRAQFVQMIYNALDLAQNRSLAPAYSDATHGQWFYNAVSAAKQAGLLNGVVGEDNNFNPNQEITRQEMTAIVSNIAKKYKTVDVNSITSGNGSVLTRAQGVQIQIDLLRALNQLK